MKGSVTGEMVMVESVAAAKKAAKFSQVISGGETKRHDWLGSAGLVSSCFRSDSRDKAAAATCSLLGCICLSFVAS